MCKNALEDLKSVICEEFPEASLLPVNYHKDCSYQIDFLVEDRLFSANWSLSGKSTAFKSVRHGNYHVDFYRIGIVQKDK